MLHLSDATISSIQESEIVQAAAERARQLPDFDALRDAGRRMTSNDAARLALEILEAAATVSTAARSVSGDDPRASDGGYD